MPIKFGPIPQENRLDPDRRFNKILEGIKDKTVASLLPKPPLYGVLVGQSGSGKSSWWYNYLKLTAKYWDEVYVFSTSSDSEKAITALKIHGKDNNPEFFDDFDHETIMMLCEDIKMQQEERYEKNKPPLRIMMIFDDILGGPQLSSRSAQKGMILEKLACIYRRHYHISVIIAVQFFKQLNPCVRTTNSTHLVLFSLSNVDLEAVLEEHAPGKRDKNYLKALYMDATENPYQFMIIDRTVPELQRYRKGLNIIYDISREDPNEAIGKSPKTRSRPPVRKENPPQTRTRPSKEVPASSPPNDEKNPGSSGRGTRKRS